MIDRKQAKSEIRNTLKKLGIKNYEKLILNSKANDAREVFKSLYIILGEIDQSF